MQEAKLLVTLLQMSLDFYPVVQTVRRKYHAWYPCSHDPAMQDQAASVTDETVGPIAIRLPDLKPTVG